MYDARPARAARRDAHQKLSGSVAQLVEQYPFKVLVLGSSPSRPTIPVRTFQPLGVFAGIRFKRSVANREASLSGYF